MTEKLDIHKGSPKEFWDNQHEALGASEIFWIANANKLLRACRLLNRETRKDVQEMMEAVRAGPPGFQHFDISLIPVSLMLGGLAIECLLKAVDVGRTGKFKMSHDLLTLAKKIDVPLSDEDRILLEVLQEYIEWGGRYPVPKTSEAMRPREFPDGSFGPRTWMFSNTATVKRIEAFTKKLRPMLKDDPFGYQ